MDTKRERKKRISRAIQYWLLPNESEAYSTSNESIRAQDSLIHVYVFIHESHVPRTVRRKNEYTLKEDSVVYTEFWGGGGGRGKNRWEPMDTEKARKPGNKIAESETRMELKARSDEKLRRHRNAGNFRRILKSQGEREGENLKT